MKKIAVVTATRAEYCFMIPLIDKINKDQELDLDLIVTGTHLSEKYGKTVNDIINDGFPIAHKINILSEGNLPINVSKTMSNAIIGFAKCFEDDRPDAIILSGDRTETLAIAISAVNDLIPIIHLHGGEVTEGAVDDSIRHAITKLSYLHFTTTEDYKRRVIQLGESPDRVFNVGSLGTENILNGSLMSEEEFKDNLNIPQEADYAVVTFHPVTLEGNSYIRDVNELFMALTNLKNLFYVITGSNADAGGEAINEMMMDFCKKNNSAVYVKSLGMKRYLSAVKYAKCVIGNSSSGIIEAPVLGTPTVNIGNRQKGRLMPDTVISCDTLHGSIERAIKDALQMEHRRTYMFGDGNTSGKMIDVIKDFILGNRIKLMKGFYDL